MALFEFGYWVVITLIKYFKSSVEPEEEDPIQKQFEEMDKRYNEMNNEMKTHNKALKNEIASLKEILMKNELLPPQEKPAETIVITDIE